MTPRRGEIWLVDFGEPVGREQAGVRPAVVVSTDALNEGPAGVLVVVPVTAVRRDLPSHVEIEVGESGLEHTSYAKCEDMKSISERRFVTRLGDVGPEPLFEIGRVLRYLLEL
ncbi:MAG: type II toxin-antitoxin system PemK/MazF family toxin [Acidimicrobiia bacterium]